MLAALFASPAYTAVRLCVAVDSPEVVRVAVPLLSVPLPRVLVPSLKVTLPVAVDGDTVAVRTTGWPKTDGFTDEVRVVVVGARFTV